MNRAILNSPVGYLEIVENNDAIIKINYLEEHVIIKENKLYYLNKTIAQINEYFKGKRKQFDLKLKPEGTDFQKEVWKEVLKIPFGETRSYQEIADNLGDPGAVRAVGNANGHNPIPILIPCHRVIGSDGKLTGYSGGISRKEWLLKHELTFSDAEMQLGLF
ncbi:MAG: methylated-DNA--[protein]-cysteine S-methyltransferase [Melioribacteraceae bacterium]|nr:MAG: methylated-DNA--[protein]-cysteine S-methyltransferase [Melioribacteraceae bacterium]